MAAKNRQGSRAAPRLAKRVADGLPPATRSPRAEEPTLQIWILCDAGQLVDILTTLEQAHEAYEEHLTHIYGWSPGGRELGALVTELQPVALDRPWCLGQYIDLASSASRTPPEPESHLISGRERDTSSPPPDPHRLRASLVNSSVAEKCQ